MKTATPCGAVRSGSLAFPASSLALARFRAGLRGLPRHTATFDRSRPSGPLRLRLLFRALERSLPTCAGLLSWDSLELALASPLHRRHRAASTPDEAVASSTFGPTSPGVGSCSAPVVSHHLDGLLRIAARGLVASRCRSWGSPCFTRLAADRRPFALARDGGTNGPIPTVLPPLEGFPSSAAVRRRRRRCPPVVPRTSACSACAARSPPDPAPKREHRRPLSEAAEATSRRVDPQPSSEDEDRSSRTGIRRSRPGSGRRNPRFTPGPFPVPTFRRIARSGRLRGLAPRTSP